MQKSTVRVCLSLAVAAGLSAVVVGCSSHHAADTAAVERREKAVDTVSDIRNDLKRADSQIVMTQQSLQRLSTQQAGDLKPTFTDFRGEVSKNRAINESLDGRSRDLATEASRHVNEWDYRARTIETDSLRQRSMQREQQARREQEETLKAVNDVRGTYTQYIRQLEDISTYAANDLTPRGVTGMREQVQRADQAAQDLRNRLAQLDVRLDRLATSWRSDVPLAVKVDGNESAQPAGSDLPSDDTTPAAPADQPVDHNRDSNNGM